MTPELASAVQALTETIGWGYGLGLGFVVLTLVIGRSRDRG